MAASMANLEVKLPSKIELPFSLGTRRCRRVSNDVSLSELLRDSNDDHSDYLHAVHCIIWAPWPHGKVIHEKYPTKAAILMQLRFDGSFGFAGGLVDESKVKVGRQPLTETHVVNALNRELSEEMNLNANLIVTGDDHMFTDVDDVHRLYLHFFALKVTSEVEIRNIERDAMNTNEIDEVFGLARVPLFTMDDGFRGFPTFLNNSFIGNARDQLLSALKILDILTDEEISAALEANRKLNEAQVA